VDGLSLPVYREGAQRIWRLYRRGFNLDRKNELSIVCRMSIALALLCSTALIPSLVSAQVIQSASPSGTVVPPAAQIVDQAGNIWVLGPASPDGGYDFPIFENGIQAAYGVGGLLYYGNGSLYTENLTFQTWYLWTGLSWQNVASPLSNPPPAPPSPTPVSASSPGPSSPSPVGTTIPPAAQIIDQAGNVWTLGTSSPDGGYDFPILENGTQAGYGVGGTLYYNGNVYTENLNFQTWYVWTGSSWQNVPAPLLSPAATATPAPAPTLTPSPTPTAIPPATQITDQAGNVWTLGAITRDGLDFQVLKNGVQANGGSGGLIYYNGNIFTENILYHTWYQWNGSSWSYTATDPRPNMSAVPPGYVLTFDDEFTTLSISGSYPATYDGSNWYMGPSNALNCCLSTTTGTPLWMYPQQQDGHPGTQDPSPYSLLTDGGLEITMNYYPNLTYQGQGIIYSGDISTVDQNGRGFSQKYGYWEVSAQFPSGTGVWPAIWMLPANVAGTPTPGGEIDIQEGHSIASTPTQMAITLHDWTSSTNPVPGWYSINEPTTDTYHVYGMLWTAQTMTFYFDNQQVWQTATPAVMNTPYYLILDLGLGSGWPAGLGITPFPQDMRIQHVRVYNAP
jgi:hypothetical protein